MSIEQILSSMIEEDKVLKIIEELEVNLGEINWHILAGRVHFVVHDPARGFTAMIMSLCFDYWRLGLRIEKIEAKEYSSTEEFLADYRQLLEKTAVDKRAYTILSSKLLGEKLRYIIKAELIDEEEAQKEVFVRIFR